MKQYKIIVTVKAEMTVPADYYDPGMTVKDIEILELEQWEDWVTDHAKDVDIRVEAI